MSLEPICGYCAQKHSSGPIDSHCVLCPGVAFARECLGPHQAIHFHKLMQLEQQLLHQQPNTDASAAAALVSMPAVSSSAASSKSLHTCAHTCGCGRSIDRGRVSAQNANDMKHHMTAEICHPNCSAACPAYHLLISRRRKCIHSCGCYYERSVKELDKRKIVKCEVQPMLIRANCFSKHVKALHMHRQCHPLCPGYAGLKARKSSTPSKKSISPSSSSSSSSLMEKQPSLSVAETPSASPTGNSKNDAIEVSSASEFSDEEEQEDDGIDRDVDAEYTTSEVPSPKVTVHPKLRVSGEFTPSNNSRRPGSSSRLMGTQPSVSVTETTIAPPAGSRKSAIDITSESAVPKEEEHKQEDDEVDDHADVEYEPAVNLGQSSKVRVHPKLFPASEFTPSNNTRSSRSSSSSSSSSSLMKPKPPVSLTRTTVAPLAASSRTTAIDITSEPESFEEEDEQEDDEVDDDADAEYRPALKDLNNAPAVAIRPKLRSFVAAAAAAASSSDSSTTNASTCSDAPTDDMAGTVDEEQAAKKWLSDYIREQGVFAGRKWRWSADRRNTLEARLASSAPQLLRRSGSASVAARIDEMISGSSCNAAAAAEADEVPATKRHRSDRWGRCDNHDTASDAAIARFLSVYCY